MTDHTDRALGELPDQPDERRLDGGRAFAASPPRIVDVSISPTADNFDLAEFIAGVRPTRRSVQIFPNAHLIGRLEQLRDMIEQAPQTTNVDDLIDEFEATLKAAQRGVWFTVERRSSEWTRKFRADTERRLGLRRVKTDRDAPAALSGEDETTISLHQLAEQIIDPAGVTADMLQQLRDNNEGECAKLIAALTLAQNELAETAEVWTADFSQRRSTSRETQES